MYLRELSTICLTPLRIAFDHLGLKGPYEQAVRFAHEFGLTELSNYMLYNFHDSPADLYARMRLNVVLNEELGIRIWSFPMRYQPTDLPDRSHIGEKWSRYQLRSLQIVLQATHGVVSGQPTFFKRAFGDTLAEFEAILLLPHHYIFNRDWYEMLGGRDEFEAYQREVSRLSRSEKTELLQLLSSCDPRSFVGLQSQASNAKLRAVLRYYLALPKERQHEIVSRRIIQPGLADDERVEDAGLEDDPSAVTPADQPTPKRRRKEFMTA